MSHSHKVFILDTEEDAGTFTPNGGSARTLNSVVDWSYNETGTATVSNSDANPLAQAVYVDDIMGNITVNVKDVKQFEDYDVGEFGVLVLRGKQREQGKDMDTPEIDLSFGKAIVTDINSTVPHSPESTGSISFQVVDNGSGALYTSA